jgi:predicted nucleotidyltransferase
VNGDFAQQLADLLTARPERIAAVYLYGSFARGESRPDSDIDLGILLASPAPATFDSQPYELEGDLERILGRPVQVVVLNHAPVDLRIRVLRGGRLIMDRDPSARIRFEVQTRNEAFDLEPILRRYRAAPPARS